MFFAKSSKSKPGHMNVKKQINRNNKEIETTNPSINRKMFCAFIGHKNGGAKYAASK